MKLPVLASPTLILLPVSPVTDAGAARPDRVERDILTLNVSVTATPRSGGERFGPIIVVNTTYSVLYDTHSSALDEKTPVYVSSS
ncbi:hypothetical protein F4803DRAFT_535959 [Xylaria telfairii]|nr:hypothetical protein F4803DRAFT_535959 [Xylaria telfairii]